MRGEVEIICEKAEEDRVVVRATYTPDPAEFRGMVVAMRQAIAEGRVVLIKAEGLNERAGGR